MNVKLIEVADFEELSSAAAAIVEQQVLGNSHSVLGLATGSTPIGLYEKMAEGCRQRGVSYKNVQTINLDEYRGLDPMETFVALPRERAPVQCDRYTAREYPYSGWPGGGGRSGMPAL